MKLFVTIFTLFITLLSFSQSKDNNLKINDISVSVTVDSAEEIESTLKIEDIKDLLKESENIDNMSFEIICNGKVMSNGEKSKLAYKVKGDSNDINGFIKSIKKMKKAAIKYYKNQ